MNLAEAINTTDIGHKHIILVDKNDVHYYYSTMDEFKEFNAYEQLAQLEVLNIDCSNDTVAVFYLW